MKTDLTGILRRLCLEGLKVRSYYRGSLSHKRRRGLLTTSMSFPGPVRNQPNQISSLNWMTEEGQKGTSPEVPVTETRRGVWGWWYNSGGTLRSGNPPGVNEWYGPERGREREERTTLRGRISFDESPSLIGVSPYYEGFLKFTSTGYLPFLVDSKASFISFIILNTLVTICLYLDKIPYFWKVVF